MDHISMIIFYIFVLSIYSHIVFGVKDGCTTFDKKLICQGNIVQEVPDEVPAHVTHISLQQTNISVLSPSAFNNITKLETFAVTSSELRSLEPGVFDRFIDTLRTIKIIGNYNLGTIKSGVFSNLNNLGVLDLRENVLTTLDGVLVGLTNLYYLNVDNNSLTFITGDNLKDLHSIKHIDVRNNNIRYVNFSYLESLETLLISNNAIVTVDFSFEGLTNLTELDLHSNQIRDIAKDTLSDLTALKEIDLSENELKWFHPGTFSASKSLIHFIVSPNPLKLMDDALPVDLDIQFLNLTHCHFESVPRLPENVRILDLSFNQIKTVHTRDVERYLQLNVFILEENALDFVEQGAFEKMTTLYHVVLANNKLKEIPGPLPRCIRNIQMDNNTIGAIEPTVFKHGTQLEILSLRKNDIKTLAPNIFDNLHSIRQFHLDNNPLIELKRKIFRDNLSVEQLYLNRLSLNIIEEDWFSELGTLHILEMSFVRINYQNIRGNFFKHLSSLNVLKLNGSPYLAQFFLDNIDANLFGMAELSLMDNGLTISPALMLNITTVARQVWLRGNDFHCDDSVLDLHSLHVREPTIFRDFSILKCGSPPELKGRYISDLADVIQNRTNMTAEPEYESYGDSSNESYEYIPDLNMFSEYLGENRSKHLPPFQYDDGYEETTIASIFHTDTITQETTTIDVSTSITSSQETHSSTSTMITSDANPKTTMKTKNASSVPSNTLKEAGIAIGTSLGVILAMLIIAFIVFKRLGGSRPTNSLQQNGGGEVPSNDYVFIVSANEKPEPKVHRKLTRSERGSTTSRASEDITNTTDVSMKVYTLDVDA